MESQQTPIRTAIMRIMSDMLDSPDSSGIYETTRFMDRIEQLICDMMAAPETTKLSGSEALYGFIGWLTTREGTIMVGEKHVATPLPKLIDEFCKRNNLTEPRESWADLLVPEMSTEVPSGLDSLPTPQDILDGKCSYSDIKRLKRALSGVLLPACDNPECRACQARKIVLSSTFSESDDASTDDKINKFAMHVNGSFEEFSGTVEEIAEMIRKGALS
ncbi:MAG: hypothetical protein GXP16_01440 [Gammaproteobacteria bacterium]|nr:hypothetical protein [Gammaproteobacteria bacterium]